MSSRYALTEKFTPAGPILTPEIEVDVSTVHGWRPIEFIIDTGADFTGVPKSFAAKAGVDLTRCPKETVLDGYEGRVRHAYLGQLIVRFGPTVHPVRCYFLEGENVPYLLGRADVFNRFNILFHNDRKEVEFVPYTNR